MKTGHLICVILIPLWIGSGLERSFGSPALDVCEAITSLPLSSRPTIEMKFREMKFGKPPLVRLYFDLVLRNSRSEPRWFLLPKSLSPEHSSIGPKGGVDGLEVFAPQGKGRVIIGHFLGTGGFQAMLLPAGAEVRLRLFPISFWGDLPDHLQVELLIARRLTIGGEDAEVWFGENPVSSGRADIAERSDNQMRMLRSRHTPDNKEVATLIKEDRRIELQVAIKRKD